MLMKALKLNYCVKISRKDKEPLIFGAKTEFEAKEWMVAVRHLAEKAHQTTVSRNTHPHVLTYV